MNFFVPGVLFLLGLAVGSFLNVVIFRYSPSENLFSLKRLWGRSECRACKKTLAWYELIPLISFFVQRGKCRVCKTRLSWQYPFVEFLCGVLAVAIPYFFQTSSLFSVLGHISWIGWTASALWFVVFCCFITILYLDARFRLIPNEINSVLVATGLLWTFMLSYVYEFLPNNLSFLGSFKGLFYGFSFPWQGHLAGFIVGLALFLGLVIISWGRGMGMGDVKLMAALGLLFGWPDILIVIMLSFILGALTSVALMVVRKKKMSDQIPFGPFIVIAAVIVFFWGAGLASLYLGILTV